MKKTIVLLGLIMLASSTMADGRIIGGILGGVIGNNTDIIEGKNDSAIGAVIGATIGGILDDNVNHSHRSHGHRHFNYRNECTSGLHSVRPTTVIKVERWIPGKWVYLNVPGGCSTRHWEPGRYVTTYKRIGCNY